MTVESADEAPREQPLRYPGTWPEESTLMLEDAEWSMESLPGRRVGEYLVHHPLGTATLDEVLAALEAAPMTDRVPVLAVGSNASGAQLRHKARAGGFRLVIPQVLSDVTGLEVCYAPFVTVFGYIPAAYAHRPRAHRRLFVQFLDPHELAALDSSEQPHYRRVPLDPDRAEVLLPSGEELAGVTAYLAEGGYVVRDGAPVRLGDQRDIIELVRTASEELTELLGDSPETAVERIRHHARGFRDDVGAAMIRAGLVAGDAESAEMHSRPGRDAPPSPQHPDDVGG